MKHCLLFLFRQEKTRWNTHEDKFPKDYHDWKKVLHEKLMSFIATTKLLPESKSDINLEISELHQGGKRLAFNSDFMNKIYKTKFS